MRILRPRFWILEGMEIRSKQKLSTLYAGVEENMIYIANLIYGRSYSQTYLGRRWLWSLRSSLAGTCSLAIRQVPLMLKKYLNLSGRFLVPIWVAGIYDISFDMNEHISRNTTLSSNWRKIERNGLNFEITHDVDKFDWFYHEIYLPYIRNHWIDQADVTLPQRTILYILRVGD